MLTAALAGDAPTEKNQDHTLPGKYVTAIPPGTPTSSTRDLGGFLRRELDSYTKIEVMRLKDIESQSAAKVVEYLAALTIRR